MSSNGRSEGTTNDQKEIVVDFSKLREKRLEEKRKNTERVFFKDLLSVYSITGDAKMMPIELIEVSEDGCSFQVPYSVDRKRLEDGNHLPIRLYFSRETYLEVFVQVQNSSPLITRDARYLRFGCSVDKTTQSYPAYQQFVRFLNLYSQHAHKDLGDATLFYL